MGSVRQENENGELCCHFANRRGIRVTSVAPRRRMRRKTALKCCNCVLQYTSSVESANEFMSSIPTHAVFIFLNPLMVDLLQVEYQGKETTPFESHSANMWIFFVATCIHCLGLAFEMKIQSSGALCSRIFSNFVLFAGALSSISLATVFLPRLLGWICLSLWALLPVTAGFPLFIFVFKWLYLKIGDAMAHFCRRSVEFMKCFSAQNLCLPK